MSSLLKISDATILAFHAMIYIAEHADRTVSTKEIASFHRASEAHLSKVMQRLARAGMVKSVRGPKGGFVPGKNSEDITLLELYELFEGTLHINNCLFDVPVCDRTPCVFSELLTTLNSHVITYLQHTTLRDAIRKIERKDKHTNDQEHNQN